MVSGFTEQQRRVLDLILRLSWGCGKKFAIIPHQSDFEIVGVGRTDIKRHLDWLIGAKVIEREGILYAFNKDFDQWRVSRALKFDGARLGELIHLNIDGEAVRENLTNVRENLTGVLGKTLQEGYVIPNTPEASLATPKESLKEIYNGVSQSKDLENNVFYSGQSLEKCMRIARGELEAAPLAKRTIQDELTRRGIDWGNGANGS